jgi:hypothetical protein
MSAAATAAGYLYASGRLRGRGARGEEHAAEETKPRHEPARAERPEAPRAERPMVKKPVRVAALPPQEGAAPEPPKRAPRIQYRVRRWRPENGAQEEPRE